MQVIGTKMCLKHNKQARFMCTRLACFQQQDIIVCPQCAHKHSNHESQLIETNQLNEKVHELMKKRMDFEEHFEMACDGLINELKKFKLFKLEMLNLLNFKERTLNQLCKKMKRNIPYEKDKNLFKKSLNYVYLAMRGINPNYEVNRKFHITIKQTLIECRKTMHKLEVNLNTIGLFEKKNQQICAILKTTKEDPISQLTYRQPVFKQFKKQTLKFTKAQQEVEADSKLFRLNDEQFLAYNEKCHYLKWYNTNCFLLPRSMYIGRGIEHLTVLGKNIFMTEKGGRMTIYDMINQKQIKQYASNNHKAAQICSVLSLDSQKWLNFVTQPNQIVTLTFNEQTQQLKRIKGVQTQAKCLGSLLLSQKQQFVVSYDDHSVSLFKTDTLQIESRMQLSANASSMTCLDSNTFLVGTENSKISLIDKRMPEKVTLTIPTLEPVFDIKKIYPSSILYSSGKSLKVFDLKVQKELFSNKVEEVSSSLEILSSDTFVASGKNLHLWKGVV